MKRREFISLLGGAGMAAFPLAARAQQGGRMRRIGVIMVNAEGDAEGQTRIGAFLRGLSALGWTADRNVMIDYRWGAGAPERAQTAAMEMVALAPDVILANGTPAVTALQRAMRGIPIVFVVITDPVGAGFVESLARPGGNITGFSTFEPEIGSKWLELLKEVDPRLKRIAGILDPGFQGFATLWRGVESMAPRLGLTTRNIVHRNASDDIESAVATFAEQPGGGLLVLPTAINNNSRRRIFAAADRHRVPAIYPFRHYAVDGGLMSYGFDTPDLFRRSASYVDRILKSEKPADLPVQAPTKFELVINFKTAKALGIEISPTLLARADEVIE